MSNPIIENPESMIGKCVHVTGWPQGCVFNLISINGDGSYTLCTPKTRKTIVTRNSLRYTNKNLSKATRGGKRD